VPRDRNGTFELKLVPKHRRRLKGFDHKVLALYARGLSTRDIQEHIRELYGTDVAPDSSHASPSRCSTRRRLGSNARWSRSTRSCTSMPSS
jgi:hypothetical protein